MTRLADTELLDHLRDAIAAEVASEDAPRPSAELLAYMHRGAVIPASPDDLTAVRARPTARRRPGARARPAARRRLAVLVAATVGLLACSLAAAGALPAPVQRGVAGLVRHVGIDLPAPREHHGSRAPARSEQPGPTESTEPVGTLPAPSTVAPPVTLPGPVPAPLGPIPTVPIPTVSAPTLPTPTGPTAPAPLAPLTSGANDLLSDPFSLLP